MLWCFDTVGLVIWPAKIVPEMTYYVSSGTLNPIHTHPKALSLATVAMAHIVPLPKQLYTEKFDNTTTIIADCCIYTQ